MFGLENVELEFTLDSLEAVAKMCITDKTGARGLRSIFEKRLLQIQYDLPDLADQGTTKIVVNADVINSKTTPMMLQNTKPNNTAK